MVLHRPFEPASEIRTMSPMRIAMKMMVAIVAVAGLLAVRVLFGAV